MSVRLLHIADLHLGREHRYLGARAEERQREADSVLERIVEVALDPKHGIHGVLIAGDLFERFDPDPQLCGRAVAALRRLIDYNRFVLTVPGNHDEYTYPQSVYRRLAKEWPGVLVTQPEAGHVLSTTLAGKPFHFYGMAYIAALSQPPFDAFPRVDKPGFHVGVFHASLDPTWKDRSIPLSGEAMAKIGLDYLALGHIHVPTARMLGKTLAVYPGAPEGNGFSDPGVDRLTVVDFGDDGVKTVPLHFAVRRIRDVQVDVTPMHTLEDLEEALSKLVYPEVILRVRLTGLAGFDLCVDYLRGLFAPRCYHLEMEDAAERLASGRVAAMAGDRTIRGLFVRSLREQLEQAESPEQRRTLELALRHGLAAFGEVLS